MLFNIIFKTIFEYIHKKFRFMHTNTFCKYRKNYSHRLACILLTYCISYSVIFFNIFKLHPRWSCNYAYEGTANVHQQFIDGLPVPRYIMSIIVSSYQYCNEQQFQTLSCALYTISSVIKLDLVLQALLLDYVLALEKKSPTPRVHLVFIQNSIFF